MESLGEDLSLLFHETADTYDFGNSPVTRGTLIEMQSNDPSLASLMYRAVSSDEVALNSQCYYLKDGLLMRKFRRHDAPCKEAWGEFHQIIVPTNLRSHVISLSHDLGHLGVRKTQSKIMKYFFWPGLTKDVSHYIKVCHACQLAGKGIKKAPLQPIKVSSEPFEKILIDCVGPLPKSKRGNEYLLTIMDSVSRYPEAFPIRSIHSKTIVNKLVEFFTKFGFPKTIQSDQGSNFTSKVFQQAMREMGVKQQLSSVYHPESQGVLERFHSTLKKMLTKYCNTQGKDWDEGVPLMLFAIREAPQESLGCSPNEILFGRDISGPLKLFYQSLLHDHNEQDLTVYVSKLKGKLSSISKFVKENLLSAQDKMKVTYDRNTQERVFSIGDEVLLFLPTHKPPFTNRFEGPYTILDKKGKTNYVISTPDKRKKTRLVHINLLREYHGPKTREAICLNSQSTVLGGDHDGLLTDAQVRLSNSIILANPTEKIGHLDESQQSDITRLLNDFRELFKDTPSVSKAPPFEIELKDPDQNPIKQCPYRVNPVKREIIKNEVKYLIENNLAEPSNSPWASPCILVPKPDNTYRLCTDFRKLNDVTKKDSYPLVRIDDLIDEVGKSNFVTKLDLLKGYYQVPLSPKSKETTAFCTPDGLYQYRVLPFGLTNAPAVFQRFMQSVLSDLDGVSVYLDDIVVHHETWSKHIHTLHLVFQRLHKAGLTVNLAKSDFGHGRLSYLGHEVGGGSIAPVSAKIDAILSLPSPQSRKSLQRFLGMVGYYRRFCQNFSSIVSPLTDLTSNKVPFLWQPVHQQAFEAAKRLLISVPVLKAPDFSKPFVIQVDACDRGVGGVLMQEHESRLHPVAFMSHKLKKHQENYSTVEKECLAIIMAIEKFHVYIIPNGNVTTILSDHNPLSFLKTMYGKNARLTRWALAIQPYNLVVKHIRGKENLIADCLSRNM